MAIKPPILKCVNAYKHDKSVFAPKIFCTLSGCYCKHVEWQDGEHWQTEESKVCPKYAAGKPEVFPIDNIQPSDFDKYTFCKNCIHRSRGCFCQEGTGYMSYDYITPCKPKKRVPSKPKATPFDSNHPEWDKFWGVEEE